VDLANKFFSANEFLAPRAVFFFPAILFSRAPISGPSPPIYSWRRSKRSVEAIYLAAAAWERTMQGGGAVWRSEGTVATYLWHEEKSHRMGVRRGHEKPAGMPFAKPRKVWHFCQFSSSKCQLA